MRSRWGAEAWCWLVFLGVAWGLTGCASPEAPAVETTVARFFLESDGREAGRSVRLPQSGVVIEVAPKPVLMEFDLQDVQVARVELGPCLAFRFTPAAARDLYRLSARASGRRLVLVLNDEVLGARRLEPIGEDGPLLIFLEVPDERLSRLAESLRRTTQTIQQTLRRQP